MSSNLIWSLINVCEKASNIARICRVNKQLLGLLVQEKTGAEANTRFEHDFKTLADVLIQETIKYDIGKLFPEMLDAIKGEESPSFTNSEGVTITVKVGDTVEDTGHCLSEIIQGKEYAEAVSVLATEVHREVFYTNEELGDVPDLPNLDFTKLGIWIDPIDATAEYIAGGKKTSNVSNIAEAGLECVTVLIGVYERDSGIPIMGIISQPFYEEIDNHYKSRIYWGVALPELRAHNLEKSLEVQTKFVGIFSSSEQPNILSIFKSTNDWDVVFSAGAGHKALKVVTGDAAIYLLSKGSTFKWDTCAPHAILRSLNGDMFDFVKSVKEEQMIPINYMEKCDEVCIEKCNTGGIIAVRDLQVLTDLLPKFNSD